MGDGRYASIAAAVRRHEHLGGQSADRRKRCATPARCSHSRSSRTATCTAGATRRRSSTAPTTQWFVGMDDVHGCTGTRRRDAARDRAATASRRPRFYPAWGKARLHGMIANRPDWTLRASASGACRCRSSCTRKPASCIRDTLELLDRSRSSVEQGGIEAWQHARSARDCSAPTPTHYDKITRHRSTSGSTPAPRTRRAARLARSAEHRTFPADLYLEGSDQHRGWFHSSLLTVVRDGRPRRRTRRCSRTASPSTARAARCRSRWATASRRRRCRDTLGAEILRLWVAATDYSGELAISDEILKRVVEAYRRIRNTLRFLLANTADFDPATARGAARRACSRSTATRSRATRAVAGRGAARTTSATSSIRWSRKLQIYCSEDLGGFYLDMLKDRLYTTGAEVAGAPLGADGAVAHHARAAALDGADPVVHRRRSLAVVRGGAGRQSIFIHTLYDSPAASRRAMRCSPSGGALRELRDAGEQGDRGAARGREASARRCRPSVDLVRGRRGLRRRWRASATTSSSC